MISLECRIRPWSISDDDYLRNSAKTHGNLDEKRTLEDPSILHVLHVGQSLDDAMYVYRYQRDSQIGSGLHAEGRRRR